MFSIKLDEIFYYICIILMYTQNISFGQYSDTEVHSNNDVKISSELVDEIVRKVCNITAETLARSNHVDKEHLIQKIEEKLYKSASNLPHGEAYVRMLMKGVRIVAYKDSRKNTAVARDSKGPKYEEKSKTELANNIAEKVQIIANALKKSNTDGDQRKAIQAIKKIIDETASKKHKHGKLKSYSDLITTGIEQAMQKVSRRGSLETLELDIAGNNLMEKSEDVSRDISVVEQPELERRTIKLTRLKPNTLLGDIQDVDCTEIRIHLCNNINALNVLQCPSDNTQLDISKLCDGVIDCTDNSDERDCTHKVSSIVHNATKLVMQIESSITLHCYPNSIEDDIVSQQNEVLRKVLEIQLKFIEKYSNDGPSLDISTIPGNTFMLRSTINELLMVIDSLSTGLKTTLCITPKNFRKFNSEEIINNEIDTTEKQEEVLELTEEITETKVTHLFDKCSCVAGNCKASPCSHDCMVFCRQKYALGRWQCDAVIEGNSVAIDVLCDGKLDCMDHSDEESCVDGFGSAKFKAHILFDNIQDLVLLKIKSEPNGSVRNKMIRFSNILKDLHGKITQKEPEIVDIKRTREYAFMGLADILEESSKVKSINEIASLFKVLMSWNVQLVKALMRTHTGNDRIILSDGCFCSGNKCVQADCSKFCVKVCSAETLLTRYFCEGSTRFEDSVPITAICNGTAECQKKNDEFDCNKEGCRLHHLVVLRRKITEIGGDFRGTSLGEALRSWKIKVNASIKIIENEGNRPTLKIIRELIRLMLRDLVMTYAGLDDNKRVNSDHIQNEFVKISRILIEFLRVCAY